MVAAVLGRVVADPRAARDLDPAVDDGAADPAVPVDDGPGIRMESSISQ